MFKQTVVWRPTVASEFRIDWVQVAEDRNLGATIRQAAKCYLEEFDEEATDEAVEQVAADYECAAVLMDWCAVVFP